MSANPNQVQSTKETLTSNNKLRLDYPGYVEFMQDMDSGEIYNKTISPMFLVYLSQDCKWFLINRENNTAAFNSLPWFSQDNESPGKLKSLICSFSQDNVNQKFIDYLKINNRDEQFFSQKGNCNGYSFLYNYYTERGMENYFYISLALVLNWDGSQEGLSKAIPKQLPQAKYYATVGQLIERWINDLTLAMTPRRVWMLFNHLMEQNHRFMQYNFFKPVNDERSGNINVIYSMKNDITTPSSAVIATVNKSAQFYNAAAAKSQVLPQWYINKSPLLSITLKNYQGHIIEILPSELKFNNEAVLKVNDIAGKPHLLDKREVNHAIEALQNRPMFNVDTSAKQFITKPRMLEQLKYLTRLPAGVYIDVNKCNHSTTFHLLPDGQIVFYDSNDSSPPTPVADYETLYQLIFQKNGDGTNLEFTNESRIMNYMPMQEAQFQHTVYHFNSSKVRREFADFSLFSSNELPTTKQQVEEFQQHSANGYTPLHLAVMYRDINTTIYLLENGLWHSHAQDVYGCTALALAIRSGNIQAALLILDACDEPQYLNSDFIEHAFSQGNHQQMMKLLSHHNAIVNIDSFTQSAMRFQCLGIVSELLETKKINPDHYIQQALLSYDINLIELLIHHGVDVAYVDECGNSALHYSAYMANDACFFYLMSQHNIDLSQKNSEDLTPMQIVEHCLSNSGLTDEMTASLKRMAHYGENSPASSSNDINQSR